MKFTYSSGQRVLDGYTLKRGIGRGGFGEVYYAVSDGGKEVALKLVRGHNLDTELRGMAQCLNLKHPNLLTLFDIRTDAQSDHWILMEYISGESLCSVLTRHPQGLASDLARKWFLEVAQAVAYLHTHGIVHRDLKPGNIFLENGTAKVGDYGLSKFISSTQHTAQTQSVGTVHYMAPEISTGNYNKQIDVYAAGVILYEMLTGRVPFDGESAGEILMKHLTSPPDLHLLPAEYVPVVSQALAKNPAHRFPAMADMARAVEAISGDRKERTPAAPRERTPAPVRPAPLSDVPVATPALSARAQIAELCGSMVLATLFAAVAYTIWAAFGRVRDIMEVTWPFFLTVATCWAILVPAKIWNARRGDSGVRRGIMMVLGALLGLGALWLHSGEGLWSSHTWSASLGDQTSFSVFGQRQTIPIPVAAGYLSYFGLAFFCLRWWKLADRHRQSRFSLAPILAAGFWACVLLLVWPWGQEPEPWGILTLLMASAIVQLASPWEPTSPPAAKRMRLRYT
jgi:hypothetical protein